MRRRLPWSGLSAELWSGLKCTTSSALHELLVNLGRFGRLQMTPYLKKPSRSA
jgi:hypothetical protein